MYIQLNSQIICYERTGDQGTPVILIHGNGEDHHIFDPLVERLNKYNVVYAMDTRGHGESATPKEYHYSDMANDVINLIKALDIEKPYLIGYSDGGIISLLVAMQAGELLSGIVCCGANLSPAGLHHRDLREMKKDYKKYNDPKTLLMLQEPNINPDDLNKITVPTMIFAGEDDIVKQKETEKIANSIPNAVLNILPGETHSSYIVKKDTLYPYIYNFIR